MVATKKSFSEMLAKQPRILHISCHGVENSRENMGTSSQSMRQQGNFLLLENSAGEGELISQMNIEKLVKSHLPDLDLVFVAACQSEFVGKIFQRCGI